MLSRLRVIYLGNRIRRIIRIGLGTITILSKNRVVKITRRVSKSFQLQPLRWLVFHPPKTGMTRRLEHHALSLREVCQVPRLTPLTLSVVKTIRASVSQEKKDDLGADSLVTC